MPLVSLFINLKTAVSWYSAHNRNYFYAYGFFENLTSWNVLLQIKIKCVLIYFPDHVIIIGVSSTILAICVVVFLLLYKRVLLRRWVVPKSWIFLNKNLIIKAFQRWFDMLCIIFEIHVATNKRMLCKTNLNNFLYSHWQTKLLVIKQMNVNT